MGGEGEVRITAAEAEAWLRNHVCTPRSWIMPTRPEAEPKKTTIGGLYGCAGCDIL